MKENLRGIYLLKSEHNYKIGITDNGIDKRLSQLQTGNPTSIIPIAFKSIDNRNVLEALEKALHIKFKHCRTSGEWFNLSEVDMTELLAIYNNKAICTSGLDIKELTGVYIEVGINTLSKLPLITKSIVTTKGVITILIPNYGDDAISIRKASKQIREVRANA